MVREQMPAASVTSAPPSEQSLEEALRPVHNAWIAEARRFLEPTLEPGADFWTRWGAVRYLDDDFRERYRQERALVEELHSFLAPAEVVRLMQGADRIFQLRLALDRVGRRRGTSAEVAAATRDLLNQLGVWCAEIELAAARLTRESLTPEGAGLLEQLEAALPARS